MPPRLLSILIVISIALLAISGCGTSPSLTPTQQPPELSARNPHIRGNITNIHTETATDSTNTVSKIFVEGANEADTVYDKASVGITPDTRIFMKQNQDYTLVSSHQLRVGQSVEVLFADPVQMSYPVQARAIEIIIIQ